MGDPKPSAMEDLLAGERKFLHDISTPLSVVLYQVETLVKSPKATDAPERLQKAFVQIKKIVESLEARRTKIKS